MSQHKNSLNLLNFVGIAETKYIYNADSNKCYLLQMTVKGDVSLFTEYFPWLNSSFQYDA